MQDQSAGPAYCRLKAAAAVSTLARLSVTEQLFQFRGLLQRDGETCTRALICQLQQSHANVSALSPTVEGLAPSASCGWSDPTCGDRYADISRIMRTQLSSRQSARCLCTGPVRVPPCHVTNTGEEMRDPQQYDFDPEIIEKSQYQGLDPADPRPLERQIETTYEEALFEDVPNFDQEHTNYWFTEPTGGWNQEPRRIRKATIVPNVDANAQHFGDGRMSFFDLEEGQEVVGTINRLILHHGAQVDIGFEFDALIAMPDEAWSHIEVRDSLKLDAEVRIRIHQVTVSPICRFPLIAELVTPELPEKTVSLLKKHLMQYEPVFNLSGQDDIDVAKMLTGREYTPRSYLLDVKPDGQDRKWLTVGEEVHGLHEPKEVQDAVSPALLAQIRDMAAAM